MTEHSPFYDFMRVALFRLALGLLQVGLLALILFTFDACSKDKAVPVSETIQHVWTAQTVRENSTVVYTKGATANVRNYGSYRLDLSSPPKAILTDVDGSTTTGTYELQGDTKLTLKNLQPQPTGTGGTIAFTINAITATALDLTRTTANPKTGNSLNQYQLTSN